jgi:hypothetical protein
VAARISRSTSARMTTTAVRRSAAPPIGSVRNALLLLHSTCASVSKLAAYRCFDRSCSSQTQHGEVCSSLGEAFDDPLGAARNRGNPLAHVHHLVQRARGAGAVLADQRTDLHADRSSRRGQTTAPHVSSGRLTDQTAARGNLREYLAPPPGSVPALRMSSTSVTLGDRSPRGCRRRRRQLGHHVAPYCEHARQQPAFGAIRTFACGSSTAAHGCLGRTVRRVGSTNPSALRGAAWRPISRLSAPATFARGNRRSSFQQRLNSR